MTAAMMDPPVDPDAADWRRLAACAMPSTDPEWWIVKAGSASRDNITALQICRTRCPVREQCRDDYLDFYRRSGGRVSGVIAGGWKWTEKGGPRPPADELHLMPQLPTSTDPRSFHGRYIGNVDRARRFLGAGRSLLAGEPIEVIHRRTDMALSSIRQAASLVKHLTDAEITEIESGELTVSKAVERLRRSGRAKKRGPR